MTCVRYAFLPALLLLPFAGWSQSTTAATSADPYRDEPYVFERMDETVRMNADGTGDILNHILVRVQSEGTAREFSVLNFSYASGNSNGIIDFVRVHKADGSTVETPTSNAMEMSAEVSREAPMYSDIKEKHLPVRSLSSGDRLEYQFHTQITKAEAPNQFWGAEHFTVGNGVVLEQSLTLVVPEKTYVQVWSPNHPVTPVVKDGLKMWTWTSSQPKASAKDENGKMTAAVVKDPDEDSDGRKLPSVAWTTFHSWAQVGDWYRSLAEQRLQPTPAIRSKADELTAQAKTPQEQAEALYRFVATQIRYVSISFGIGRFQPHTPEEVLSNGYGDCKDKDTLLESLLRAKGLTTAPVLIGAGIAPVPDLPTPAVFNHAITTVELPGADGKPQRTWLDTTAEVAPFRVLMPVIRDQFALVIPDKAPAALEKTPADPPYPYKEEFNAEGTLDKDGLLKAHIVWTLRSDNELDVRTLIQRLSPAQWDQAMQAVSGNLGFGGKVSNADMRQSDPAAPVRISYDYRREKYAGWENQQSLPLFPQVEMTFIDKDKAPEHDIDLGAVRTVEAHSVVTLPTGYRAELPDPVHVERDFTSYDKTYRLSDGKVIADRKLVVKVHKISKDRWKDYVAFEKATLVEDGEPFLRLIPPDDRKPESSGTASSSDSSEEGVRKQLAEIAQQAQRGDVAGAQARLESLHKSAPNAPYVQGMLGLAKVQQGKVEGGISDLEAELKAHPDDDSSMVLGLASAYAYRNRNVEAIAALSRYGSQNDGQVLQMMVNLEEKEGDSSGALTALTRLQEVKPDDRYVESQIASVLYKMHRYGEATAAAKKSMDGSDDPNLINNNVYLLAEMKVDLPGAETQSRRSVELLEKATAGYAIDEANSKAFADSANLTAAWDTLAYILMLQGKNTDALPLLQAAWFNRQDVAVGNHLAQVYEELGRKREALWVDLRAMEIHDATDPDDEAALTARKERLQKEGIQPSSDEAHPFSLQEVRSYHLKRPTGVEGGGTVRLQMAPDGVAAATLVAGDAKLKPLLDAIHALKMPGAEPAGSQARVLRDAVVYCGKGSANCDFVFMPNAGIQQEGAKE